MKFMHTSYSGVVSGPYTPEEAVVRQGEAVALLCDGDALAELRVQVQDLQEMVGRLIEALPTIGRAGAKTMAEVLGSSWEPQS